MTYYIEPRNIRNEIVLLEFLDQKRAVSSPTFRTEVTGIAADGGPHYYELKPPRIYSSLGGSHVIILPLRRRTESLAKPSDLTQLKFLNQKNYR